MYIARKNLDRCSFCGICINNVACPGGLFSKDCVGCGACMIACPAGAIQLVEDPVPRRRIAFEFNGTLLESFERTTIKSALTSAGIKFNDLPDGPRSLYAPCGVGGCFCCAVSVNGNTVPACTTEIKDGMKITTGGMELLRVVTGFMPHMVGGVGTPHQLKTRRGYIEAACFTHGCNFRCPQCQNHVMAFTGGIAISPYMAADMLTGTRRLYGVDRMAFSGGECTLNRPWLVEAVKRIKKFNKDERARIHIDTNGSILTPAYIDELADAGMTDIGIDIKSARPDTFQKITGIGEKLANVYLGNEWDASKYVIDSHPEVFTGIGIPYNKSLVSKEEIREIGDRIAKISSDVQVCVLDYRPAFRAKMEIPRREEMQEIKEILNGSGLTNVVAQTAEGLIGP